jgi:NTP pyrophosphatase (non-canonical NTP hydrolase)
MYRIERDFDGTVKLLEDGSLILAWPGPNPGWGNIIDALNRGRDANAFDVDFGEDMPLRLAKERIAQLLSEPWEGRPWYEVLSLDHIREVNSERCDLWHPPESDPWLGVDWSNAMCGEAGEAANVVKKLRRLETGAVHRDQETDRDALIEELGDECADVLLYMDLLARHYGINLTDAVIRKFDRTSEKFGFPQRMTTERLDRGM